METTASTRASAADYVVLTKPGITRMVLLTTAVGFLAAAPAPLDVLLLVHAIVGTGMVSAGAGALNQVWEARVDARMARTRDRPIPAGRVSGRVGLAFGLLLAMAGVAYLFLTTTLAASALALLSVVSYILVYTPLKPVTTISTIIGGIPGGLPILIGWAASGRSLTAGAWTLFAIMFLWQIPHFLALAWMYREDYRRGGLAMLSVEDPKGEVTARQAFVYALALLPVSLLPTYYGLAGGFYFIAALAASGAYVFLAGRLVRQREMGRARRLFFGSLAYLPVVLGVLVVDRWWL